MSLPPLSGLSVAGWKRWWPLAMLPLLPLVAMLPISPSARLVLLATLASAILGASLVLWLRSQDYRRGIDALHGAILKAQEGSLEPARIPASATPLVGRLAGDYNLLIKNLGSLFQEMEQCQLWTIGERNRNDAILRGLPGALLTVDGEQRITLSNRQTEELFEKSRDELIGMNLFDLLRLDESGRELLREAFLYGQQIDNKEISLRVVRGLRHFSLNVTFFDARDNDEPSAALILQDVTEYKRLLEVTHHTEKLVAMGQLAAGVAHELNTPLGSILGYAQLLRERTGADAKLEHYARVIHGEAKRCAGIVDNLLAYARRDHCNPESCRINGLIHDVVESIKNCQGQRYRAAIALQLSGDPFVRGGAGQLDIVLVNLIVNAVQATADVPAPQVIVRSGIDGGAAVVSVLDNGPGVPPELRGRVFDPFFSTKQVGSGSGLGLAISQAIVSRIGGSLHYDATHHGAHFVLKLPLVEGGS